MMKNILLLAAVVCLMASGLNAAPPRCETVNRNGVTIESCERDDANCDSLVKESLKTSPDRNWNGCAWPVIITRSQFKAAGVVFYVTTVSVVPSYRDSERVDLIMMFERPDHSLAKVEKKDLPVIIRDNIPSASTDITSPEEPYGVPSVEATEKGGAKSATHDYK
jgi:hypothetical protein